MALQLAQAFITISAPGAQIAQDLAQIKNATTMQLTSISQTINNVGSITAVTGATAATAATQFQLLGTSIAGSLAGLIGIAAGVGAFLTSIREAIAFETNLTASTSVLTNATDAQRMSMRNLALDLSSATGTSAVELSKAFQALGQAGFNAGEQLKILPIVNKLAIASGQNLLTTVTDLTKSQEALGLHVRGMSDQVAQAAINLGNLNGLSDLFAKTTTLAQVSVDQIALSLENKGALAMTNFGISVKEVFALIGAFASQGIMGQKAGLGLDLVANLLTKDFLKLQSVFQKQGLTIFDVKTGGLRDVNSILTDFLNIINKVGTAQKEGILISLFPDQRARDFFLSLSTSAGGFKLFTDALNGAAGAADALYEKMLGAPLNQLRILSQGFVNLGIVIGTQFVNATILITKPLNEMIAIFQAVNEATGGMAAKIAGLAAIFGTVAIAAKPLMTILGSSAIGGIVSTGRALLDTVGVVGLVTKAVTDFALGIPLQLAQTISTATSKFTSWLKEILKGIPVFGSLAAALFTPIKAFIDFLPKSVHTILSSIGEAVKFVGSVFSAAFGGGILLAFEKKLADFFKQINTEAVRKQLASLAISIEHLLESFIKLGVAIGTQIAKLFQPLADAILKILGITDTKGPQTLEGFISFLDKSINVVAAIIKTLVDNWGTAWGLIVNVLKIAELEIENIFTRISISIETLMIKIGAGMKLAAAGAAVMAGNLVEAGELNKQSREAMKQASEIDQAMSLPDFQTSRTAVRMNPEKFGSFGDVITAAAERADEVGNLLSTVKIQTAILAREFSKAAAKASAEQANAGKITQQTRPTGPIPTRRELPLFSGFADFSKQLQQDIVGKDKLDTLHEDLTQLGSQTQEVVSRLDQIAGNTNKPKEADAPPSAMPGMQQISKRAPQVNNLVNSQTGPVAGAGVLSRRTATNIPSSTNTPSASSAPGFQLTE